MAEKTPYRSTCRWPGCSRGRPRHLLMCSEHWRFLPKELRHAIWTTHRPRAELGFPSGAYIDAVAKALAWAKKSAKGRATR